MNEDMDFLIRKAFRNGLNYLSLSPNHVNPKDGDWIGCYRHTETNNCQYVSDNDPVEALGKAIRQGEAECARLRRLRREVGEPMAASTAKVQKENLKKVNAEKERAEKAAAARRRRIEDLV